MTETEKNYRKRAETADLILTERPPVTTIKEAVWWPNEGYGGATRSANLEEAKTHARVTLKLGYGRDKKSVVHIIETTTRIIEVSIAPAMEEENNDAR